MRTLGPLVPADERLDHQITDTFATVAQTDRAWTEKICAQACAKDGSLQIAFGLGKYTNRGVMDAYAGVSRGPELWVVRAARELAPDPGTPSVGPIHYEVLEPLRRVRFALEPNDAQPIAFEWVFEGVVPPFLEHPEQHRSRDGYRLDADIVRYHHSGVARGWVEVGGVRTGFDEGSWVTTRDHSWGVRYGVGAPVADVKAAELPPGLQMTVNWCPVVCERPDGSRYALHWYYQRHAFAGWQAVELQGGVEHPDGRKEPFVALEPEYVVDPVNRRLRRARLHFTTADGAPRPLTVEAVGETGFHLGAGLYFGLDGRYHGQYRGPLEVEGEYVADCTTAEAARRLHQLRDAVVRVEDPVGGGVGHGNLQSMFVGPHEELGLDEQGSFM
ncbi:MAG: hypothetical protein KatS3mg009_2456 [Acidimicrobiia bacterium]|nr:MAG: hypothetical protein KatS3mg009_2456 [Acidimicrobiia bacterium]